MLTETRISRAFRRLFPKVPRVSAEQREAVRRSSGGAETAGDALTRLLCDRLTNLDPQLSDRLADDLYRQVRQLIATVEAMATDNDGHHGSVAALRALERTQACCGMTETDYDSVQGALTLALRANDMFDDPAREAWSGCFAVVAFELKAAARWRSLLIPPP